MPILKHTQCGAQFKAKMTLAAPAQTKIWDGDKLPRDAPTSWRSASVRPRLVLRGLYFMGTSFGAVVECTDLQIPEEAASTSWTARLITPYNQL